MHDESRFTLITTEQKILSDIRELLIKQNEMLSQFINKVEVNKSTIEQSETESNQIIPPTEIKANLCQYCGGMHENTGARLACAKKYKKGVK